MNQSAGNSTLTCVVVAYKYRGKRKGERKWIGYVAELSRGKRVRVRGRCDIIVAGTSSFECYSIVTSTPTVVFRSSSIIVPTTGVTRTLVSRAGATPAKTTSLQCNAVSVRPKSYSRPTGRCREYEIYRRNARKANDECPFARFRNRCEMPYTTAPRQRHCGRSTRKCRQNGSGQTERPGNRQRDSVKRPRRRNYRRMGDISNEIRFEYLYFVLGYLREHAHIPRTFGSRARRGRRLNNTAWYTFRLYLSSERLKKTKIVVYDGHHNEINANANYERFSPVFVYSIVTERF